MSTRDHTKHAAKEKAAAKAAPLGILALQHELRGRLVSTGGRPSDPAPTIRRLVTLKRQVWKDLQKHATLLSRLDQRISPGQLAAMLLEKRISELMGLVVQE
jgi:hypothetical protein